MSSRETSRSSMRAARGVWVRLPSAVSLSRLLSQSSARSLLAQVIGTLGKRRLRLRSYCRAESQSRLPRSILRSSKAFRQDSNDRVHTESLDKVNSQIADPGA